MANEAIISVLEQKVSSLLEAEPGFFLVDIRVKPTNNLKIFVDADQGAGIDKLVQLNRKLYKDLEESGLFPDGDFSLEVSSPGLDEPLRQHRQYLKNKGREVEVLFQDGRKIEGKLTEVTEDAITIEEDRSKRPDGKPSGKKKTLVTHVILFSDIKSTTVQIKF